MAPNAPDAVAPVGSGEPKPPAVADAVAPVATEPSLLALRTEATGQPQSPEPVKVRDVTPANMTAAPPVTGPLARVEPPAADEPQPEQQAPRERLFNPLIVSAGTIKASDREIRLAGIAVTSPDQSCGEGAAAWPCGRLARAALRGFVRGRAIECDIPAGADSIPDPARCFVGGDDIAEWLVAQGWAKRSGSDYAAAEKTARDGKLGLFAASRPDAQPDEVAARR